MRKLNSLLLTSDYPPMEGGIAVFLCNLWTRANPSKSAILAPGIKGSENFDGNSSNAVKRFPSLSSQSTVAKIINFLSLGILTLQYLTTNSIEHLHCGQLLRTGVFGYLRKILTGRGYYLWLYGGETRTDFFKNRLFFLLNEKILRAADMVITISPFTSGEFLDFGLKVLEIVPGVDTRTFHPQEKKQALIQQYKLRDKKVILTCGRLVERKGHDKVLEALAKVLREIPDTVYLIVGDGPYRSELEDLVRKYNLRDAVLFVGTVDSESLSDYYNLCDLFVMPNRVVGSAGTATYSVEGFGMVFLEAAACGKPVIGGDSGGAVHAVDRDVNGFLVPPEDAECIAKKIIVLLKDEALYEKFSRNGLEHVKKFSWEHSVEKLRPYL